MNQADGRLTIIDAGGNAVQVTLAVAGRMHRELAVAAIGAEDDALRRMVRWGAFLLQIWDQVPKGQLFDFIRENGCGNRKTAVRAMNRAAELADVHGVLSEAKLIELIERYNAEAVKVGVDTLDPRSRSVRTADAAIRGPKPVAVRDEIGTRASLHETEQEMNPAEAVMFGAMSPSDPRYLAWVNENKSATRAAVAEQVAESSIPADVREAATDAVTRVVMRQEAEREEHGRAGHATATQLTLAPLYVEAAASARKLLGLLERGDMDAAVVEAFSTFCREQLGWEGGEQR